MEQHFRVQRIKKVGTAKILVWTNDLPLTTKREVVEYIFMLEKYANDCANAVDRFIDQLSK